MTTEYVHGYAPREAQRLNDQAATVRDLLHHDTLYPPGNRVLEAGCGVGAQTVTLAAQNPDCQIVSIDISPDSLALARQRIEQEELTNVTFQQADIMSLPFEPESFDHVFVCYVLEHLAQPQAALEKLKRVLKPGGTITVIEGDHGSCFFHPETPQARKAWQCLIDVQANMKGNSLIGRELFGLLSEAGFQDTIVSPRFVYADQSLPAMMDGFVGKTIIPMVEGVEQVAIEQGLIDQDTWKQGIADLRRILESADGSFCYTFFKAVGSG